MAKILVTGTAGFIGFHLAQRLLREGNEVLGVDNVNDYYDVSLKEARLEILHQNDAFRLARINLQDEAKLEHEFKLFQPEYVVNLAAQAGVRYSITNPKSYIDSNLVGFANILENCRHNGVKHLVYASSSSVYGKNTVQPFSVQHNVDHPISLYAATKKANELMAHSYSHLYNLPTTGLRFFTVYGTWGRPDMAMFLFTKAILEDRPINVFNHGNMMRDFTYVDDVVEGVVRLLPHVAAPDPEWSSDDPNPSSSKAPYRIYNIGNNNPVELMYVIGQIEKNLGKVAEKNMMDMQPGDVPSTFADVQALEDAVGYKPSTSIEDGIRRFIEWYREYYKV
ncbi:MAG: NAD-dependent epimerase [Deltaproteobacteria bacterium]|nr:MAG: NAD-dependent epimerase [Deltaproteobacteria bacterium]